MKRGIFTAAMAAAAAALGGFMEVLPCAPPWASGSKAKRTRRKGEPGQAGDKLARRAQEKRIGLVGRGY